MKPAEAQAPPARPEVLQGTLDMLILRVLLLEPMHGWGIALRIEGPKAAWILSKGMAIDFHAAAFPPMKVAQSAIHEVGVILRRLTPESFDLYVYRGFALSFWEWLTEAAAETGYRVDLHRRSMPENIDGVHFNPREHRRADGFSPGQAILPAVRGTMVT